MSPTEEARDYLAVAEVHRYATTQPYRHNLTMTGLLERLIGYAQGLERAMPMPKPEVGGEAILDYLRRTDAEMAGYTTVDREVVNCFPKVAADQDDADDIDTMLAGYQPIPAEAVVL